MDKTAKEAVILLEELASQGYTGNKLTMAKAKGVLGLDTINLLSAKIDAFTKLIMLMSLVSFVEDFIHILNAI